MESPGLKNAGVWEEVGSPPIPVRGGPHRMPAAAPDVIVSPCEGSRSWQWGRSCGCPGGHRTKPWGTPSLERGQDTCPSWQGEDAWLPFSHGGARTQLNTSLGDPDHLLHQREPDQVLPPVTGDPCVSGSHSPPRLPERVGPVRSAGV